MKKREFEALDAQQRELKILLNIAENLEDKEIGQRMQSISKSFKKNKKLKVNKLPSNKSEIGDSSTLYLYVDGYDIIGCDSLCRSNMRIKKMKESRGRLTKLFQERFVNQKYGELKLDYNIIAKLWFDGNGKNEKCGDIEILFSTKNGDDELVKLLKSKNDEEKEQNDNVLVITSDKERTFRLNEIGVKVMKSRCFYRRFLKENKNEKKDEFVKVENDDISSSEQIEGDNDEFITI